MDAYKGDKRAELENRAFEQLQKKLGMHGLEVKVQRMESCRNYYRKYPYDGWSKRGAAEEMDVPVEWKPLEKMAADESLQAFMDTLTPREKEVAMLLIEGNKPRHMAALAGKKNSNAERWLKHQIKLKLQNRP